MDITPAQKRKNTIAAKYNADWYKTQGLKAKETMLKKDPDHFKKISVLGGKATYEGKGFAGNKERASLAGKIGKRRKRIAEQE